MENKPTFSIIMPTFNRAYLLPIIINSILNQSYRNFELIIINDGSTDKTQEYLNKIKDKRVIIINQGNTRHTQARRIGCLKAKGEFFAFCDSDDHWEKSYLHEILKAFKNHKADYVFTNYQVAGESHPRINLNDKKIKSWINKYSKTEDNMNFIFKDLFSALIDYQPIFTSCQAIRSSHYTKIGGISESINNIALGTKLTSEDSHIIRRSSLTKNSVFINKSLVILGRQGDNASNNYISNLSGGLYILKDILEKTKLSKEHKLLVKKSAEKHNKELCLQHYYHMEGKEFKEYYLKNFTIKYRWKSHLHYLKIFLNI
jgi:glycosyltransferase involved in cell wall biosynthesis